MITLHLVLTHPKLVMREMRWKVNDDNVNVKEGELQRSKVNVNVKEGEIC